MTYLVLSFHTFIITGIHCFIFMTFVDEINLLIEIFKNPFLYKTSVFNVEKQNIQTSPLKHNPHTQIYNY